MDQKSYYIIRDGEALLWDSEWVDSKETTDTYQRGEQKNKS